MNEIRIRLHIAPDGTITGRAPDGVPPGDHEAAITIDMPYPPRPLPADAAAKVRALQDRLARLPVLDSRTPDEILGYDEDRSVSKRGTTPSEAVASIRMASPAALHGRVRRRPGTANRGGLGSARQGGHCVGHL